MTPSLPKQVALIGVGLIGGSLALRLKRIDPNINITGYARRREKLKTALERGAIDTAAASIAEAVKEADLIILCTPVTTILPLAEQVIPLMREGAILTDVGSTKETITRHIDERIPSDRFFVGAHPMAGSEKQGIEFADPALFEQAMVILTPTDRTNREALGVVKETWEAAGAFVSEIAPADHDRLAAAVSHLPHMVASALVNTVGRFNEADPRAASMAAGGFRDTTRIAGADPTIWRDICQQNSGAVIELIDRFIEDITAIRACIEQREFVQLEELLTRAKRFRDSFPVKGKGILPARYEISVQVGDQPGALAKITQVLGERKINIVDLCVTHVRMAQGEAPIRIGFLDELSREKALKALNEETFTAAAV